MNWLMHHWLKKNIPKQKGNVELSPMECTREFGRPAWRRGRCLQIATCENTYETSNLAGQERSIHYRDVSTWCSRRLFSKISGPKYDMIAFASSLVITPSNESSVALPFCKYVSRIEGDMEAPWRSPWCAQRPYQPSGRPLDAAHPQVFSSSLTRRALLC